MRIAIPIFITLAAILLIYNITKVDYDAPFQGNSSVALIGILGSACAIILLFILQISRKIARKQKEQKRSAK
ncbi:hypothetical protein [uncultured Dokdonia sp.]|uniref:hypothetical protein n=1 Tax=uncultured Dokdonia sp. TaxID=575653 RepID=UPI002629B279|nr:hypothetical protein [uncultured Dokdonia sp.]